MKAKWEIRDLIDLEYLLYRDVDNETGTRSSGEGTTDRDIYLEYAKTRRPPYSRQGLIRYWLDRRRAVETARSGPGALPGSAVSETLRLLRFGIAAAGGVFGASLSWSLLTYKGVSPINIFTCLWFLIVPQIFLLLILLSGILYHHFAPASSTASGYPLLTGLIRRLMLRLKHSADSRLSAGNRSRMHSAIGQIGRHKSVYGGVFFWPIFILAQTFGTCFNTGALAAAFIRISITDLAFGWQSTLQPAPETVYRIIEMISRPWSWLVPAAAAHPSLAQIEGSKMVLKDGIYHLSTQNLVSWWPFLCLAILFYGLLPRLVLLTFGYISQRLSLARLTFTHAACDRLISRMKTPAIDTTGREYRSKSVGPQPERTETGRRFATAETVTDTADCAVVFIAEELAGICTPDAIHRRIEQGMGYAVLKQEIARGDPETDASRLRETVKSLPAGHKSLCRIVLLLEAWQPPIRETLSWIMAMREAAGDHTGMVIALSGRPAADTPLTPPSDIDHGIWEQAVAKLGDPYLRVERL